MSDLIAETTVEVLGQTFQIKCAESQVSALQKASDYFDEKMRYFRAQGITEFDKIAVIAALNIVHQLLLSETQKENINQRLHDLQSKVEYALGSDEQTELLAIES